jgi:hypothetical protein
MRPDTTDRPAEVFISYASRDRAPVLRVADRLATAGVSLWLDREKIPGGTDYGTQIVRGIRGCQVLLLMCSDASMRSRNVRREVQLAWKYERLYLPLLLEPTVFPEQVEYWLEACQWVEVLDRPDDGWLPEVLHALRLAGVGSPGADDAMPAAGAAASPVRLDQGLAGLRAVARFTDQIWPLPADRAPRVAARTAVRGLGAPQEGVEHGFRLGSRVCLAVESDHDAHLLLLDEGPEGTLYCLCPSHFAPSTRLSRGCNLLPQARSRYDAFVLTGGRPGREHLLAVVTEEPLGLDWMPTEPGLPARVLGPPDVAALLDLLRRLDPRRWTALSTYFDVTA